MTPSQHFEAVWSRCGQLSSLHAYLERNVTGIVQPEELLRSEWVARVSALDLYVHELVAQSMLGIFEGRRPTCPAYLRFRLSNETLHRIQRAASKSEASAAFDLDVRNYLSQVTYQFPDDIADGVRLCSNIELWNDVALAFGATQTTKAREAKTLKTRLSLIVRRRNAIAHEGDLQQFPLREPWPISRADLAFVREEIERLVGIVDKIV